jgi:glycosyltransferase involved in cell wall biosynthesis
MQSKVSIVLPFYNCEDRISDAVESMLAQTYEHFELILVNNNSSDNSFDIAAGFAAKDNRVNLIDEPQQGIVYALNAGIEEATGNYITIMDADDISYPHRLEKQVEFLDTHENIGLVSCQVNFDPASDNPDEYDRVHAFLSSNNKLITHEDLLVNRFIEPPLIHSTVMYRKELIEAHGGYSNGDFPEDYELWLRWFAAGVVMHKLPEVLYGWTNLNTRFKKSDDRITDQALFELKSRYMYDWLSENNEYHPEVVVWGAGRQSRQRFFILHEIGVQAKFYIDLRANPERKVIQFQHTPPAGRHFILSYVANRSARENNKMFLVELGYTEGKDFICIT